MADAEKMKAQVEKHKLAARENLRKLMGVVKEKKAAEKRAEAAEAALAAAQSDAAAAQSD